MSRTPTVTLDNDVECHFSASVSFGSHPTIASIAARLGRTPAQMMLRRHLRQGRSAIPKSTDPSRIAENFDIFDFTLTSEELTRLDGLDTGRRGGPDPDEKDPSEWDLAIPEA